ncbi:peptidoglycan DD-metalloendopeptidase family protein [Alkalibacterium kapii]|uniref:Peptidase n=1 Tax=Alkalibacterium kapii TaxID=426704 RepID=A0A511AWN8_9LACT|nr:peptidoglycan DD-metalloendopeptidase family protein [Alkalibacterium kapii]GEK91743.1 peptidase [Alkalibacterium kapii]
MNKKFALTLMTALVLTGSMMHLTGAEASENSEYLEVKQAALLKKEVTSAQTAIDADVTNIIELEKDSERLNEEMKKYKKEITQLEKQLEQDTKDKEKIESASFFETIKEAGSLTDIVKKWHEANKSAVAERENKIKRTENQNALEKARENLDNDQKELARVKASMLSSRNDMIEQRNALDDKILEIAKEYDMTDKEKETFINEQNIIAERTSSSDEEVKAEKQRIFKEENDKEEAERSAKEKNKQKEKQEKEKKEKKEEVTTSSKETKENEEPESNGWIRPAEGRISSSFGYRVHPVTGEQESLHGGTDIAGGGSIVASRAGTVSSAEFSDTYGYSVIIDHGDGYSTLYAHMQPNLSVSPGQSVSQGQQLGIMGTTGRSTGVHLHFEVRKDGTAVDPMGYIK